MKRKSPRDKDGNKIVPPESITPNLIAKRVTENGTAKDVAIVRETREYELITPLFGGGTESQKADPVSVIRVPSIRGQLRFWWRAIRGGQFGGNLARMKKGEDGIFGAASVGDKATPSQLQIALTMTDRGKPLLQVTGKGGQIEIYEMKSPYGYVAFPLKQKGLGVVDGVTFSLSLSYPSSFSAEVEAALWAWAMFGGLGGRTRRGFGSLQMKDYSPHAADVARDIKNGLEKHLAGDAFPPSVPHLSKNPSAIKVTAAADSVSEAWKHLIQELKDFRQDRPFNPATKRPGRSRWHEPDAIRNLTRHASSHPPSPLTVNKFPRAAFGLPIIFKFKDETAGDPLQTTLEGKDENQKRMASPLILRPVACSSSKAVGLAVMLSGTSLPPNGIILHGATGNPTVPANLTPTEAARIAPLGGKTDVVRAFLDKLK